MNSITCHVCHTQNPSDNQFCTQCGTRLQGITHIICSVCYHRNALSLSFCDNCGSELPRTKFVVDVSGKPDESEPDASDIKTDMLIASIVEDGGYLPEWLDSGAADDESTDPLSDELMPDQKESVEDEPDIDWMDVLNLGEQSSGAGEETRESDPPEVTDWLAELSNQQDGDISPNTQTFTEELLMPEDATFHSTGEIDQESSGDTVDSQSSMELVEEGSDVDGESADDDLLSLISESDPLALATPEVESDDSTGLTDWLSEIEEKTQDGTDPDANNTVERSEAVIDELPNWFSLNDDEDSNSKGDASKEDTDPADAWLLQSDESGNDGSNGLVEPETNQEGVTSWLNNLSQQTLDDESLAAWVETESEEPVPTTPKFPTWLLDEEDDSAEDIDTAKTGFTDWLTPIDDSGESASANTEEETVIESDFSWLTDDNSTDDESFGETAMADWLVGEVNTTTDVANLLEEPSDESLFDEDADIQLVDLGEPILPQSAPLSDIVSDSDADQGFDWLDDDPLAGLEVIEPENADLSLVSSDELTDDIDSELDGIEWLDDTADAPADEPEGFAGLFEGDGDDQELSDAFDLAMGDFDEEGENAIESDANESSFDDALADFDAELASLDDSEMDTGALVEGVSFDEWLSGDEGDLLDSSEETELPLVLDEEVDDESEFAEDIPLGTGFTSWLRSEDLPSAEEVLAASGAAAEDANQIEDDIDPESGESRTGFTGWLTAEEEAESEEPYIDDTSGAVIPEWLKDSDELPTLAETADSVEPAILGEGNETGQSFSDWLKESGVEVEEAEEEDLLSESEPTGFTQWLTDPASDPLDLSVLDEAGDDDWLENIIPVEDDTSDEVEADMPDWLTGTPAVPTTDAAEDLSTESAGDLPDWMLHLGTGELDPSVLGEEIDELLETGDPEWIAELESGPLHSDLLPDLDEVADVVELETSDDELWGDSSEENDLFDDLLHVNEDDEDNSLDDDAWLASLNLNEESSEVSFDIDVDSVSAEEDDDSELAVNTELPAWLMAARPDEPNGESDPERFSFESAGDDLFADSSEDAGVDAEFLEKLGAFEDDDGELDLNNVSTDWTYEDETVFEHQDLSDDQLATADVPDWLQPEEGGLAKANIPDWLQSNAETEDTPSEQELYAVEGMAEASAVGLNTLTQAVPIAPAIGRFITTQVQSSTMADSDMVERQNTKASSWADIVKHDVDSTTSNAPKAPKVKAKRPPKIKKDEPTKEQNYSRRMSLFRIVISFFLFVMLFTLWRTQPEIIANAVSWVESLLNIDLSSILP